MGALSSILIMKIRNKIEITSKERIKDVCYEGNKEKFAQTIGTSVIRGNLIKELAFLDNSIAY